MPAITFYEAPFSSATPVAHVLAELDVPHERVRFDLKGDAHKQPAYLAINPNGKVPCLVVDGTPIFEGLAITLHLGERFGVQKGLWPAADSALRLSAMSWACWTYVTFSAALNRRIFANSETLRPEQRSEAHFALAERDLAQLLSIAEERLASRDFMLGPDYSLVDTAFSGALTWATFLGVSLTAYPRLDSYLARCKSRPAFGLAWR